MCSPNIPYNYRLSVLRLFFYGTVLICNIWGTFFVTDKLRYKIINYQYFKSISDMNIPAKSNLKGCQMFDLNVFRSAGVNLSTKRRGVKNPQNRENVIYECSLSTYI